MDDVSSRNKSLQKEVERLTTLLQLSERKRFNQKVLYDKNLENLHEKLADFESVLNKERKEIQLLIQKKDQQIKVREDLAKALQGKLDSQYCRQCGYPSSKNQFDTDWEIGIDEGKKSEKYRKLPPLSLPLPEILPNVSFSNRLSHSKSKLSPVAEECEVASSSYLRNIHADQNPDRFHAVLTASLECLQVDKQSKKNITPESEYPDEAIATPTSAYINSNLPQENQLCPRKLDLVDPPGTERDELPLLQTPRPSIVIDSCENLEIKEPRMFQDNISEYADGVARSILNIAYKNFLRYRVEKKFEKDKAAASNCLRTFSDKLALGILSNIAPDIRSCDELKKRRGSNSSIDDNDIYYPGPSLDDFDTSSECNYPLSPKNNNENDKFNFDKHNVEKFISDKSGTSLSNHKIDRGEKNGIPINVLSEKPRSFCRGSPSAMETNKVSYSRLSTMVVPLVDQAITVAKTIVRRRSSTNFLAIDDSSNGDMKDKLSESADGCADDNSAENLSFHRRTLIELIDQAVEQVIPTVNCFKDGDLEQPIPTINSNKGSNTNVEFISPIVENGVVENGDASLLEDHNDSDLIAGCAFNEDDQNEEETLSTTIVSESTVNGNKEHEVSKSKKKKNKKKKRKKKGSVSDAGNRLPESVDQMEADSVSNTDNGENGVITECGLDCSFDANDVITSSLNNSETEISTETEANAITEIDKLEPSIDDCDQDKFSLLVDQSFNEMEESRGSTPDTLDGY